MKNTYHRFVPLILLSCGIASAQNIDERYFQSAPGSITLDPSYLPSLAREAGQEARRFVDDAYSELAATYPGQQVIVRGQAMVQQVDSLQAQIDRFGPTGQNIRTEAARFDATVGGARAALSAAGGVNAPSTSRTMRRIERLSQDISTLANSGVYYPPNPPPGSGIDRPRLRSTAQKAAIDANQAASVLYDSGWNRSYPYDHVVDQLNSLAGLIQQFTSLIDRQASDNQIRNGLMPLQTTTVQINRLLGSAQQSYPPPPSFTRSWTSAESGINRLANLANSGSDPTLPPIITPPTRPPVRPPPNPTYGGPLALLDQMTPTLDQFVATLRANINSIPNGFQFLREAQTLQSLLGQLRRGLIAGQSLQSLQQIIAQADHSQRRINNGIQAIAGNRSGPNIDRIRRVSTLFDQLKASLLD
jgi:hypothetical protein